MFYTADFTRESCMIPQRNGPTTYHSNLSNTTPSQEELDKAQEFYKRFKCTSLLDYLKIYCETDVLILAEVFCDTRNEIWTWAEIDISHFVVISALFIIIFYKL